MELTKELEIKLKKEFKKTLERYIEYRNATDWKNNNKGYINKGNIDNIVFWLIDKIKTIN